MVWSGRNRAGGIYQSGEAPFQVPLRDGGRWWHAKVLMMSRAMTSSLPHACTGAKTGRSPRDKRIVKDSMSEKDVWWAAPDGQPSNGSPNYEMDERCVDAAAE